MRFLTKEEGASFDRLGPEYDKNYQWWGCSDRSVVNAVEKKRKKKKGKSVVWKAEWQFSKDKGRREVRREQWNRFYFPMISATLFGFLRPF